MNNTPGIIATAAASQNRRTLEIYTISTLISRRIRPGGFEVAFAGDNLALKTGDTVTVSKDGVTAPFKLGRLIHFGNTGGGSLGNDKTESLYVFSARIVQTPFYVVQALVGDEPIYILSGVYLTPAAAFAGVEQAKGFSNDPERSFGVFEVSPTTKAWHLAKRVLSEAEQAAELRALTDVPTLVALFLQADPTSKSAARLREAHARAGLPLPTVSNTTPSKIGVRSPYHQLLYGDGAAE